VSAPKSAESVARELIEAFCVADTQRMRSLLADDLLFVLYGRIPQWRPIAKGQLLTWGRRPWRAAGFKRLFLNP
jgi:hypothetical protein